MHTYRSFITSVGTTFVLTMLSLTVLSPQIATAQVETVQVADLRATDESGAAFFERHIRPILVDHCYECHSEEAGEQQGGLLLDRQSGWIEGGERNKAVVPGQVEASLLVTAVRYQQDDMQMPPDGKLSDEKIELLERWIRDGAPGPKENMGETEFSRLGDQPFIFEQAAKHWSFKKVVRPTLPVVENRLWSRSDVDRFIYHKLDQEGLSPSRRASPRELYRRLRYSLTGLPPTKQEIEDFTKRVADNRQTVIDQTVDRLIESPAFGQHFARMWLDLARYADTDSSYRADTKTPHYFPFAFTYRDYVVDAFNADRPYDQFLKEQFAADLLGISEDAPETAALGFLGVAPHAKRAPNEALDDWIDVTTRGLMGLTVACARCHDHKYEPIPTVDYYSLRGVFASLDRPSPLDEKRQPILASYQPRPGEVAEYQKLRAVIDKKITAAEGKKAKGNNRSVSEKIRETELAQLLLFHPGAPARSMVVVEKKRKPRSFVHVRGDVRARGDNAPPRFLKVLEPEQAVFSAADSGRLDLVNRIATADNPLTARVYVNRIWGYLVGSHIVATPSDFGLQGDRPTHPELLDFLAADFVENGWSTKRLVRQIVTSEMFAQSSQDNRASHDAATRETNTVLDPTNRFFWRSNRRHLSIEAIRDSILAVTGDLDVSVGGRAEPLWPETTLAATNPVGKQSAGKKPVAKKPATKNQSTDYTLRRAIYGYINRFNLDPTLRAFDFPSPMQSQAGRGESIVAPQALFLMNSPFVTDQMQRLVTSPQFSAMTSDEQRMTFLFQRILQREPAANESVRVTRFIEFQKRILESSKNPGRFQYDPWPLIAQSLVMSNEFQYVD